MGLVGAQKLAALYPHDGHGVFSIVEPALDVVQVHDSRVSSAMGHLVYFLQPLHFAVAVEGVLAQKELSRHH